MMKRSVLAAAAFLIPGISMAKTVNTVTVQLCTDIKVVGNSITSGGDAAEIAYTPGDKIVDKVIQLKGEYFKVDLNSSLFEVNGESRGTLLVQVVRLKTNELKTVDVAFPTSGSTIVGEGRPDTCLRQALALGRDNDFVIKAINNLSTK